MERDPKFVQLYNKIMVENKAELENLRRQNASKVTGLIALCIIFIVFVCILLGEEILYMLYMSIYLIPVIFIIAVFVSKKITKDNKNSPYTTLFKTKVILPLVQSVFQYAEYNSNKGLDMHLYNNGNMGLYNETYIKYYSEDTVITHDKNDLVFSEVRLEDERQTKDGKEEVLVFWGIAGNFASPVHFTSPIKIFRNRVYYGDIKMDSEEFESNFNIYTKDKITTMSILTADVMTKLVDIKKRFGRNLEIALYRDKVYFRIDYYNLFEAKIDKDALSIESIEKYYNLLSNVKELSNSFVEILKNANI